MWEYGGYRGAGNVEPLLGSVQGRAAAVCGNARSVFDELNEVLTHHPDAAIFAANDVGMYLPRLNHWATLHYEKFALWRAVRKADEPTPQYQTHTNQTWGEVDWLWHELTPSFALSGYFAMQLAYLMGFEPIILCGCPGDGTPRFFESSNGRVDGYAYSTEGILRQLNDEMRRVPDFKRRVRSMSGFTQQFFGGAEWQSLPRK